ncbi:hypothetical protein [Candidatus Sodalis pierantonius]|uniref:hypothetical protein n=1 Tax=Candidatus Sodalis pierantonii TaxID=1486991 RepID=UPI00046CA42C|nr:hypothetical protein [Candidatus Sodalis pierantonius]
MIKTININALIYFLAQKIGDKTQQSTTIHDIFINNLPLISTCRLRQNRQNLTAQLPIFDEGNPMRYSRLASANSGAGISLLPILIPRQ